MNFLARAAGAAVILSMSAAGAASVSIDDLTDTLSANVTGADPSTFSITIQNETADTEGDVVISFSFKSIDPNVPTAATHKVSRLYNIFEADGSTPSDRLSITLTGLATTSPDDNNVAVLIGFASASEGDDRFSLFKGATTLFETGLYQTANSGLTDLQVQFRSDVERVPGPVVGAGLPGPLAGFGAMLAWYRRRRAAV